MREIAYDTVATGDDIFYDFVASDADFDAMEARDVDEIIAYARGEK